MFRHLKLFRQLPLGARFTFESPYNPNVRIKTSPHTSQEEAKPNAWHEVHPDVLVFTEGGSDGEVFATGNASELLGA
jgi:hypothetical protein